MYLRIFSFFVWLVFIICILHISACITDIRIDNKWFPMRVEENVHSPAASLSLYPNVEMGCKRDDCSGVICAKGIPISRVCVPLWDDKECR